MTDDDNDNILKKVLLSGEEKKYECSSWAFPKVESPTESQMIFKTLNPKDRDVVEQRKIQLMASITKKAYDKGFNEGKSDGQKIYTDKIKRLDGILFALEASIRGINHLLEKSVFDLAVGLAKAVIYHEVRIHPESIKKVVIEGLKILPKDLSAIDLHLHPDDLAAIKDNLEHAPHADKIRLVENKHISRGGCVLDSEIAKIDATIEKRMLDLFEEFIANQEQL